MKAIKASVYALLMLLSFGIANAQIIIAPREADLRDRVVVDARTYGVKANDGLDDYAAVMKAVAATPVNGILEFPKGVINLSQRVDITRGDIWLRGVGGSATQFVLDSTVGANNYVIKFAGTGAGNPIYNITVSDLQFDGSDWLDGENAINKGTATASSSNTLTLGAAASATDDFYNNCYIVITEDATNPQAVGAVSTCTDYNGTSKIANVGTWSSTPSSNAKYAVLLINNTTTHTSNGNDQITRGYNRLGFYDCENVKIFNFDAKGGFGCIDFRRVDRVNIDRCSSRWVIENFINFLSGTDSSSEETCEYVSVTNCVINSGEGIDASCDYFAFSNIVWEAYGYGDECVDVNSSHYGVISAVTGISGSYGLKFHGAPTGFDSENLAHHVTVSSCTFLNQISAGISFLYGTTTASSWSVSLGTPSAGTFTLTFGGNTTSAIAYDADAATVQAALEALASLDVGEVLVSGAAGGPYTVYLSPGNEGTLTGSGAGLTGGTFLITDVSQDVLADVARMVTINGCVIESDEAGCKGIEASWTSTSYPIRIGTTVIQGCTIKVPGRGVDAPFSNQLKLTNNYITSTAAEGISANHATHKSQRIEVLDNTVIGHGGGSTSGAALNFGNVLSPKVERNTFTGLTQGYAVKFANCKNVIVRSNEIIDAISHGLVVEWTSTANIESDNDLRTEVSGNRVMQFGTAVTGRFGISVTCNQSGTYSGLKVSENYVTYTVANSQSKAYNFSFSSGATVDATITGNRCTDVFNASSKWTLTGVNDTSAIWGNKFGTTFGAGTPVALDGWYQEDVPGTQSVTEANYFVIPAGTTTLSTKRWLAGKPGSITRVWVKTSAAVTAGTLTITVYKNGSTTGFACTVTSGTTGFAIQPSGMDTFVLGDALSIYVTSSSITPAGSMDVRAGFDVEY